MTKANKAADFLANMNMEIGQDPPDAPVQTVEPPPEKKPLAPKQPKAKTKATPATRAGLKHIGGYCDDDTAEKFAIMRVRLKLDNSELLTEAIQELYKSYKTKKAFAE
jgi:hypothetical protein